MLSSFVIALREGVEAALIIAIAVAYLRKTGRDSLLSSVYKACGSAVFASVLVAVVLYRTNISDDRYEGPLLLVSAVFVLSLVLWMNRHARGVKGEIETGLQQRTETGASRWGIFLFVFLMIFREGVELVLIQMALRFDTDANGAEAWSEALLGAGSLAVDIADARAGTDAEVPQFDEPGAAATPYWPLCRVSRSAASLRISGCPR